MADDGRAARYVAIITDGNGRWAARARAADHRGPSRRRRRRQGAAARRRRARRAGAHGLLVLHRELVAARRGGHGADADVLRAHPRRDAGAARRGRAHALHRAPRGRLARARASRWTGPRPRPPTARRSRCSSPSTTAAVRRSCDAAERYDGGGEEAFRALLYAPEMHDPDVVIRTSGEQRLSNYLLWQSAYAELVFRDELWPDFAPRGVRGRPRRVRRPRGGATEAADGRAPAVGRQPPSRRRARVPRSARTSARTSAHACSRRCR